MASLCHVPLLPGDARMTLEVSPAAAAGSVLHPESGGLLGKGVKVGAVFTHPGSFHLVEDFLQSTTGSSESFQPRKCDA